MKMNIKQPRQGSHVIYKNQVLSNECETSA